MGSKKKLQEPQKPTVRYGRHPKNYRYVMYKLPPDIYERLQFFKGSEKTNGMSGLVAEILRDHLSEYETKYSSERVFTYAAVQEILKKYKEK